MSSVKAESGALKPDRILEQGKDKSQARFGLRRQGSAHPPTAYGASGSLWAPDGLPVPFSSDSLVPGLRPQQDHAWVRGCWPESGEVVVRGRNGSQAKKTSTPEPGGSYPHTDAVWVSRVGQWIAYKHGLPRQLRGKESTCQSGRCKSSTPGSGRSPGVGNGNPAPVFLPGKFHG